MIKPLFFFSTAQHFLNEFSVSTDGVDEYVNLGDIANFDSDESFSLVGWIKTVSGVGEMISRRQGTPSFKGWSINNANGQIGLNLSSNNATTNRIVVRTTATDFNDGNWHHIVCTYDGTSVAAGVKIYIDGQSESVTAVIDNLTGAITNIADANIASRNNGENPWNGLLDELAIYDMILSASEITKIYNLGVPKDLTSLETAHHLIGWWRFTQVDKDNFPVIADNSGNGNDGVAVNMASTSIQGDTP